MLWRRPWQTGNHNKRWFVVICSVPRPLVIIAAIRITTKHEVWLRLASVRRAVSHWTSCRPLVAIIVVCYIIDMWGLWMTLVNRTTWQLTALMSSYRLVRSSLLMHSLQKHFFLGRCAYWFRLLNWVFVEAGFLFFAVFLIASIRQIDILLVDSATLDLRLDWLEFLISADTCADGLFRQLLLAHIVRVLLKDFFFCDFELLKQQVSWCLAHYVSLFTTQ